MCEGMELGLNALQDLLITLEMPTLASGSASVSKGVTNALNIVIGNTICTLSLGLFLIH